MSEIGSAYYTLGARTDKLEQDFDAAEGKIGASGKAAGDKFQKGIGDGTSKVKGHLDMVKGALAALGVVIGIQTVVKFFGDAIRAASDLNEVVSKTGQIFGQEALPGLEEWAATAAEAFGQSKRQALEGASTFAIFGKSAGLAGQDLVGFSTGLVELASDLASFHNTSPEEAITAIGAALRGENEPIRRFGVLLDDATLRAKAMEMGLISTTKNALTPQQKVLAAHQLILAQTSDAQGDFARTADGLANSQRTMAATWEDALAAIGDALLPLATGIVTLAKDVIPPFVTVLSTVIAVIGGVVKVIDVLKPGLIALGLIILSTMIPALVAMGVAAAGAAAAMIVAFAPVLVPLAAVAAAVAGISLAVNTFAIDFGDMGDRLHKIADDTGVSYDEVKARIQNNMSELGMSFDEAANEAETHFGRVGTAGQGAGSKLRHEAQLLKSELPLAAEVAGQGFEDAMVQHFGSTDQQVADYIESIIQHIKDAEQPFRDGGKAAADAWADPLLTQFKIAEIEAELSSAELARNLRSKNPEIRRDAEQRRVELTRELITLKTEHATQGDETAQITKTKALLTSKFMRDGLESKDPEIRAIFRGWYREGVNRISALEGAVYKPAYRAGAAIADGLAQGMLDGEGKVWQQAQRLANLIRTQMPGSEPKDPRSPLRGITKGFGFGDVLAKGILSGSGKVRSAVQEMLSTGMMGTPGVVPGAVISGVAQTIGGGAGGGGLTSITVEMNGVTVNASDPADIDRLGYQLADRIRLHSGRRLYAVD